MTIGPCEIKSEASGKTRSGPTYTRVIQIPYSEGFSAAGVIFASDTNADPLLLHYGQVHPDDERAVVTAVSVADPAADGEDPQSGLCDFTITFSPFDASYVLDPLERPAEINWGGGEDQTETYHKDYDGTDAMNSAGDYYDPLPERDIPGADGTISRFEADNPADILAAFSKSTNSAALWGQAIDTMKMGKITATKVYENNVPYWKVTYPFYITTKNKGWREVLIDNGFRTLDDDGNPQRSVDNMNHASPSPILLDGSGGELDPDADPVEFPAGGLKQYPSVSWAAMSLPNPFA
jgi:hypothetical protein